MTDKINLIYAEIKKRYEHQLRCIENSKDDNYPALSRAYHGAVKDELFEILCFLDVLNKDSEEPVSDDLEKAAVEYATDYLFSPSPVKDPVDHFKAGAQWQKEQVMKTVVDGKIYETQARSKLKAATIGKISNLKYRVGDKVKLIILKED